MEDQIVTYETSNLAKENGFDLETLHFYTKPNSNMFGLDEHSNPYAIKRKHKKLYKCGKHATLNKKNVIFAPSQSLLQKWLREKHSIDIEIYPYFDLDYDKQGYEYIIYTLSKEYDEPHEIVNTYEKALETGLQEALTLIK